MGVFFNITNFIFVSPYLIFVFDKTIFEDGLNNLPISTSALASNVLQFFWFKYDYKGYQISNLILGNFDTYNTPALLNINPSLATYMPSYIKAYGGGRNESFAYGYDKIKKWLDEDIKAAYTTSLAGLPHPDYTKFLRRE